MGAAEQRRGLALRVALLVLGLAAAGCGGEGTGDGGNPPGQPAPGLDAGAPDAGAPDAGAPDAGAPDAGAPDAGAPDAGPVVETGATFTRRPFSQEVLETGLDAAGATYVLLRYTGTPEFGGTTLPNDGSGTLQHAVVRLDAALQATAVRALPSGGSRDFGDEGPRGPLYHLAVLPDGSVALGGTFRDPLVTPAGTLTGRPFPATNGFIALIAPDGTWRWARALSSDGSLSVQDVAASAASIAVVGSFSGAAPLLGAEAPPEGLESQGFLLRVDLEGTTRTAHVFTGSRRGFGAGVALGPLEDSFIAGHTVVSTAEGNTLLTPYLARVNANGGVVWAKRFGEFSGQLEAVAVAPDGRVAATGRFNTDREVRWGDTLLSTPAARTVLLMTAYDGPPLWGRELGRAMLGVGLAQDARGLVTVAGRASGVLDLGGGPRGAVGEGSLFVARYSGEGGHQWSSALPLPGVTHLPLLDVAVGAQGAGRIATGTELIDFTPTRP